MFRRLTSSKSAAKPPLAPAPAPAAAASPAPAPAPATEGAGAPKRPSLLKRLSLTGARQQPPPSSLTFKGLDADSSELVFAFAIQGAATSSNDFVAVYDNGDSAASYVAREDASGEATGEVRIGVGALHGYGEQFVAKYHLEDNEAVVACETGVFTVTKEQRGESVPEPTASEPAPQSEPEPAPQSEPEPAPQPEPEPEPVVAAPKVVPSNAKTPVLPVSHDAKVPNYTKDYAMLVDWDADQLMFRITLTPSKSEKISPTCRVFLVQTSPQDAAKLEKSRSLAVDSEHDLGSMNIPETSSEDGAPVTFLLEFFGVSHDVAGNPNNTFRLVCTTNDEKQKMDKKVLVMSQAFRYPMENVSPLAKSGRVPAVDGSFTATWNAADQTLDLDWTGAKLPRSYYYHVYLYRAAETNKIQQLHQESLMSVTTSTFRLGLQIADKVKQGETYYCKIIKNQGSGMISMACSNDFTVSSKASAAEMAAATAHACELTVVGEPEVEVVTGQLETLIVTVGWKFSKEVQGLGTNDTITVLPAQETFDANKYDYCQAEANGTGSGKVEIALGGYVDSTTPYVFCYVSRSGSVARLMGRSASSIVFASAPKPTKELKDQSRKANQVSGTQHQVGKAFTKVEFNPLLTVRPEPSMWGKMMSETQAKRKKRRASQVARDEEARRREEANAAMAQKAHGDKIVVKPVTGEELLKQVANDFNQVGGFVYVGAGASMSAPSASPSWWTLMNDLLRELFRGVPPAVSNVGDKVGGGDVTRQPEEIMESFYYVLQDRLLTVFRLLEAGEPNANHIAIAKLAKAGKLRGILTTNFDIFIERALKAENVAFKAVVTHEEFEAYYKSGCKEFAVLKIHGTVDRPDTIVAVANHYKRGKGFTGFKEKVLAHFLQNHATLFLGYSGWDFMHANYQKFWAGEGAAGGKNVYWLNLLGARGGPNLGQVLGLHIGKRLVVGEGLMPGWACDLVGVWDKPGSDAIVTFQKGVKEDVVKKNLDQKRKEFLMEWVGMIPKPQLYTLVLIESSILNTKSQERLARTKGSAGQSGNTDVEGLTQVYMQLSMDLASGKLSQAAYDEQMELVQIQQTFQYMNAPAELKEELKKLVLAEFRTNKMFQKRNAEDYDTPQVKSMLPSVMGSIVSGLPVGTPAPVVFQSGLDFVRDKLYSATKSEASDMRRQIYMSRVHYMGATDPRDRKECERLIDEFVALAVSKGWDIAKASQEATQSLDVKINQLVYGMIDTAPIIAAQFKDLAAMAKAKDAAELFVPNAFCVALGLEKLMPFRYAAVLSNPEFSKTVYMAMFMDPDRTVPVAALKQFTVHARANDSPDRRAVTEALEALAKKGDASAKQALAAFQFTDVDMYIQALQYGGLNYQEEVASEGKGYFPRMCVPPNVCKEYFLPALNEFQAVFTDERIIQPLLASFTVVGECLNDVATLQRAADASLKLTDGKVLETTPVGIPESCAFALQLHERYDEALVYWLKALDGVKTSVMRHKTDAIVLQACLVQSRTDVTKALRLAFTFSPHFSSSTQQFSTVGAGRSLLVQQCIKWATEDLKFASLDDAEEKLMAGAE